MTDDQVRVRITVTVSRNDLGDPQRHVKTARRSAVIEQLRVPEWWNEAYAFGRSEVPRMIRAAGGEIE